MSPISARRFLTAGAVTLTLTLLVPMTTFAQDVTPPPVAQRIPHPVTLHGDTRPDDYAWLRDKNDARVISYLDTENAYSADGLQLLQTVEPLHNVVLDDGSTVQARQKTVMRYDEGAPAPLNLLTTSIEGAYVPSTGAFTDQRVTSYQYDNGGWDVRQPVVTITDPGGLNENPNERYGPEEPKTDIHRGDTAGIRRHLVYIASTNPRKKSHICLLPRRGGS